MPTRIQIKQRAKRALSDHYGIGLGLFILPQLCYNVLNWILSRVTGSQDVGQLTLIHVSFPQYASTQWGSSDVFSLALYCLYAVVLIGASAGYIKLFRDQAVDVGEPFRSVTFGFWRKLWGAIKMELFLFLWSLPCVALMTFLTLRFIAVELAQAGAPDALILLFGTNVHRWLVGLPISDGLFALLSVLCALLMIPSTIKRLSYAATGYILAEYPEVRGGQAINLSKRIMRGNRWELFVAELSFVWWALLGIITFGIVLIFYVTPYMNITLAGFYTKFRDMALLGGVVAPEELGDSLMAVPAPEPETE